MKQVHWWTIMSIAMTLILPIAHAALLSADSPGFGGQTRGNNYDDLVNTMCSNNNVVTTIGNKMWVPWHTTSTSCTTNDLQQGSNCNSGETIDATHNCMVTDEFSQVGVLVSMANNQARMDQFFNTVKAIKSTHGQLPAWRIYRSGDTIEACRPGINGNCDTASDATARIIIALFTASNNPSFTDQTQKSAYRALAVTLSKDFLNNEVVNSCLPSTQGYGNICWWLASGSNAKTGGIGSNDFAYTGYYPDAITAMLMACSATNDRTYCQVAGNFTLNYLQAANFDGKTFTAPPGKSFKWTGTTPTAVCTSNCAPTQWDSIDAPRALGICQANYYAKQIGITLPRLQTYCNLWGSKYYTSTSSAPVQFSPNGAAVGGNQEGHFAQGLEALYQSGGHNTALFGPTLDNALAHYSTSTNTWDYTACFGVYTESFAMRALGFGIGRDAASFKPVSFATSAPQTAASTTSQTSCITTVNNLPVTCSGGTITQDRKTGCRTIVCTNGGDSMQVLACDKPTSPASFELYKQSQVGTRVTKICLAGVCISDNGFARGEYPICTTTNSVSTSLSTTLTSTSSSLTSTTTLAPTVKINIAPWYPQGRNYVFQCAVTGFVPTSYDWNFGDGQQQSGMTRSDVYHTYSTAGTRSVICTAKNAQTSKSGILTAVVQ